MTEYLARLECGAPLILVVAILIDRLGGEVVISQADIDRIAYGRVWEGFQGPDLLLKNESKTSGVPS